MSTTTYRIVENYAVGIEFLDETTVIAGHGTGKLIIASFGMAQHPHEFKIDTTKPSRKSHSIPLQTIESDVPATCIFSDTNLGGL